MTVCVLIGVLMMFRQSIRNLFSEDPTAHAAIDSAWSRPEPQEYEHKTILELHYFNSRLASVVIAEKIAELKEKKLGIHTLLISGSNKIDTNTYIRELAKTDWGIEEIRLHTTGIINIYAFMNLVQSSASLQRIFIWNNSWDEQTLKMIRKTMKDPTGLKIMQ
jgi:hypothetical protein